ncbi:MAG: hypothetical protein ACKVQW_15165 [Pyrinomonadaceae bacterium]
MKKFKIIVFFLFIGVFSGAAVAQTPQLLLKRTTTKTEKIDFGSGGTLTLLGAPNGSIRVKGTNKNEIEITAEIEVQAANEADLALLANVTGFIVDERLGRASIITIGTHNKLADKKLWKKFPQKLAALPFRIDYTVSVPLYSNLEIDGGKGDLSISNIEGAIKINFVDANAKIEVNGDLDAIIGAGSVDVVFGPRFWRARPASVQMATGELIVQLPPSASAEIDATILKSGTIDNKFAGLTPRNRKLPFTDRSIAAKMGVGGPQLKFTLGEGNLKIVPLAKPQ